MLVPLRRRSVALPRRFKEEDRGWRPQCNSKRTMARLSSTATRSLSTALFHLHDTHLATRRISHFHGDPSSKASTLGRFSSQSTACDPDDPIARYSDVIQGILKLGGSEVASRSDLDGCELPLCEDLVLDVLRRHRLTWKPAFLFFDWALSRKDYKPGSRVCEEMLDILGRAKEVCLMRKVFDEMSQREDAFSIVTERTFEILTNRYAGACKVQEAVELLYKRKEHGFSVDGVAFEMLLSWLCRHKHVEEAEALFLQKQEEFPPTMKSRNIILNGWCVAGKLEEANRFWEYILATGCQPDLYTYGTYIDALARAGELATALDLYTDMWEKGCHPDVVICNCVIDALCHHKRISDALAFFQEMSQHGCRPNVATYNTLIKHLCKMRRVEKARELFHGMKEEGLHPDSRTFAPFLRSSINASKLSSMVDWMRRNGYELDGTTYKLVLCLYIRYNNRQGVEKVWAEMERLGIGPDQPCYTACIHWHCRRGRFDEALRFLNEMQSKGIPVADTRAKELLNEMETKKM